MASYGGHALPGIIFLIFGCWITIRESLSSLSTRHSHRHFLRKDGVIILCAVALGSFVELFWPWNGNHPPFGRLRDPVNPELFFKPMNWQHFTMYLFFGIYGCTRIIEYRAPFLTGIDRLSAALAFFIEGFLFQNHVHGRSEIDKLIHILIVVICYASASFFLVSFFINCQRKRYLIDMVIGILVFAQGTWFIHVAEIIYGKNAWPGILDTEEHEDHGKDAHGDMIEEGHDEEGHMGMDSSEHMNMMFAVIFFSWHLVCSIIINSLVAFAIYKILKKKEMIDVDFVILNSADLENNNEYGKGSASNGIHYESVNLSDKSPLLNGEDDDEETDLFARA